MNRLQLDAIRARREYVSYLEDQWESTSTPEELARLLDAAIESSDDIDTLLAAWERFE